MSDLIEQLRRHGADERLHNDLRSVLVVAADRIEYLESVAGAVSQGESMEAIRARIKANIEQSAEKHRAEKSNA